LISITLPDVAPGCELSDSVTLDPYASVKARHRYLWGFAALVISAILLLIFPGSRPVAPGIQFCGVAAPSTNTQWLFLVTNRTDSVVLCAYMPPQVKSNNHWMPFSQVGQGARLAPHQCATVSVTAPIRAEAWRLPVLWDYPPARLRVLRKQMEEWADPKTLGGFPIRYTAYSPEVVP
jgi:hypothetical protein